MFKKIKKSFIKSQKGVVSAEWIICAPFSLIITFFSIMILIFALDYNMISSSCSNLADCLNMGDTGYEEAANSGRFMSRSLQTGTYDTNNYYISTRTGSKYIDLDITNDAGGYFNNSAIYFINKINDRGGFTMPFVQMDSLSCKVYYPYPSERTDFTIEKGITESGDMIVVKAKYKFFGFIPVTTTCYGFID